MVGIIWGNVLAGQDAKQGKQNQGQKSRHCNLRALPHPPDGHQHHHGQQALTGNRHTFRLRHQQYEQGNDQPAKENGDLFFEFGVRQRNTSCASLRAGANIIALWILGRPSPHS